MANLGIVFDATQVEPAGVGGGQLPLSPKEGWKVVITESEMKETQAKDGSGFLELTLHIVEGEHAGTEGKYRINLFNKNEQAQNIAHKQLSALCHVVGVFQVSDSALLHNRPFRVIVGLQKGAEAVEKRYTEVKGVLDINGNQPGKAGSAPAQASAPPQAPVQPPPVQAAPAAWTPPAQEAAPVQSAAPAWGAQAQAAPAAASAPPWAVKPA